MNLNVGNDTKYGKVHQLAIKTEELTVWYNMSSGKQKKKNKQEMSNDIRLGHLLIKTNLHVKYEDSVINGI